MWLIFAAGCVVSLRFLIFGAALQPYFRHLSWPKRLGLGYFTTDMGFVLFMPRFGDAAERGTREQLWYFIGTIAPGWLVWASSIVGIYLGTMVPATWSLDFAAVLALLAITVPLANSSPCWCRCWRPDWSPGSGRPCRCGWVWPRDHRRGRRHVAERFFKART